MRYKTLDTALAITIAWIWLVIVIAAVVGYGLFRWWRKRRALPNPKTEHPYAQRLQRRMNGHRAGGKPSKPSKRVRMPPHAR